MNASTDLDHRDERRRGLRGWFIRLSAGMAVLFVVLQFLPLGSYLWIHWDAKLKESERKEFIEGLRATLVGSPP